MLEVLKTVLITGGSFLLVLSLVVFVHEFGHFQVARWRKVAIKSFSLGMGPEWFGWTDKRGTRWKVSKIPIGGFVSFVGDADATSTQPADRFENPIAYAAARRNGLFHAQPIDTRAMVSAAGPLANFLFSIVVFAFLIMLVGRDTPRIDTVAPNSAAAEAGFRPGDVLISVDGEPTHAFNELIAHVGQTGQEPIHFVVSRDGQEISLTAAPRMMDPDGAGPEVARPLLGLTHADDRSKYVRVNPIEAIGFGVEQTGAIISGTANYIGRVFTGRESGAQIAGPVGIMQQSGKVAQSALTGGSGGPLSKIGTLAISLLGFAAVLSVAVGIANLLPIPILDGGHLVFYAVEALRGGKPLPPVVHEWALRVGLIAMGSLFLFATWNDVARGFTGS